MTGLYLGAIILSLLGLALVDRRFKLVFFANARLASVTTALLVVFFSIWDAAGIANGIFFKGDSEVLVGFQFFHEYPLEELFFLTLFGYFGQVIWSIWQRYSKRGEK